MINEFAIDQALSPRPLQRRTRTRFSLQRAPPDEGRFTSARGLAWLDSHLPADNVSIVLGAASQSTPTNVLCTCLQHRP